MRRLALLLLAPLACAPLGPSIDEDPDTSTTDPGTTADIDATTDATTGDPRPTTDAPPATDAPDDSTSDTGDICEALFVPILPATADVMLVLDRSGSMDSDPSGLWDHDADDTDDNGIDDDDPQSPATPRIARWASLHAAVESLLTAFATRTRFGAVLFPSAAAKNNYDESACPVSATPEVPVAGFNAEAILAAIPEASGTDLRGGSPTAAAFTTALTALTARTDDHPHAIVLVTDGPANCATDAPDNFARFETLDPALAIVVAQAHAEGVPTFVVGVDVDDDVSSDMKDGNPDNINAHAELDALAVLGGHPLDGDEKFFNTRNEAELVAALTSIGEQLLPPCTAAIDGPDAAWLREVRIGGARFEHPVADCTTDDGFRFTDASQTTIELCGEACDIFRQQGGALVYSPCWPD